MMWGIDSFDRYFSKIESLWVKIALETDKKAVCRKDSGDLFLHCLAVFLIWEDTVLNATGKDAGGAIRKVVECKLHVLWYDC